MKLGCGGRFLSALMSIYRTNVNVLKPEYVRVTIGGEQGGRMSCIMFIIYDEDIWQRYVSFGCSYDDVNG